MTDITTAGQGAAAPAPGLRERSKARRRAAIQRTAMRLFAERGYDATTIADIADAAEVAPRTVTGYFSSKQDLATAFADEIAARVTAAFAAHPDADILSALETWLDEEVQVLDPDLSALANAMYKANPELGALSSAHVTEAVEVAGAALAAHLGLPAEHPMVAICGAALGATITSYCDVLTQNGPSEQLHALAKAFARALLDAAKSG